MKLYLRFCLLCLITFQSAAFAEPLRLGAPFFPPYVSFDFDGNLTGSWYDQLAPALEAAEIEYIPVNIPIKRFYSSIATGKIQLCALPKGIPGMENVLLSEEPFSSFDMRVFWLDRSENIDGLAELADKRLVLIKGYSYGGLLRQAVHPKQRGQFVTVESQADALKMLVDGEADYVLGYWALMSYLQKNFSDVQLNNHKVAEIPIYIAMHKSAENSEELMARVTEQLTKR